MYGAVNNHHAALAQPGKQPDILCADDLLHLRVIDNIDQHNRAVLSHLARIGGRGSAGIDKPLNGLAIDVMDPQIKPCRQHIARHRLTHCAQADIADRQCRTLSVAMHSSTPNPGGRPAFSAHGERRRRQFSPSLCYLYDHTI